MQINVKMYILVSSFAVTFCAVTEAWLTKYDYDGNFADHKWGGQVKPQCVQSDEECTHGSQCCNRKDACLMDPRHSFLEGRKVGFCSDMGMMTGAYPPTKFEGERCEDSSECTVGCCVSIRRHRYGVLQVCAEDTGPFMCISSSQGLEDILKK